MIELVKQQAEDDCFICCAQMLTGLRREVVEKIAKEEGWGLFYSDTVAEKILARLLQPYYKLFQASKVKSFPCIAVVNSGDFISHCLMLDLDKQNTIQVLDPCNKTPWTDVEVVYANLLYTYYSEAR